MFSALLHKRPSALATACGPMLPCGPMPKPLPACEAATPSVLPTISVRSRNAVPPLPHTTHRLVGHCGKSYLTNLPASFCHWRSSTPSPPQERWKMAPEYANACLGNRLSTRWNAPGSSANKIPWRSGLWGMCQTTYARAGLGGDSPEVTASKSNGMGPRPPRISWPGAV